jgi:hypothetical protein
MENKYLNNKVRRQRKSWNVSVRDQTPIAVREKREWKPAIFYTRFADDFVVTVKGNRSHAAAIKEEINSFLSKKLLLTLNMDKTHITHVNDGFTFLGHRIIRKRGGKGKIRTVTQIPLDKFNKFSHKIVKLLSSNYSINKIDMVVRLNQLITGWSNFYSYTTYTAMLFQKLDTIIFWKFGHWLARKYRTRVNKIMRKMYGYSKHRGVKTWLVHDTHNNRVRSMALKKCIGTTKKNIVGIPNRNPYLDSEETMKLCTYSEFVLS